MNTERVPMRFLIVSYLVEVLCLAGLSWQNTHVGTKRHVLYVDPFLLGAVFCTLAVVTIIAQTPRNPDAPRWQIWHWFGLLTSVVLGFFAAIGLYCWLLYGGMSQRFPPPARGFDAGRVTLGIVSFIGIPILVWLFLRSMKSRQLGWKRNHPVYDAPPEEVQP